LDHRHSIDTHAAERYLLGELTAVEAEAFELHYFDCPQCALAVESGEMFISSVREAAREADRETDRERFPAPAAVPSRERKPSFRDSLRAFWRQPAFGFAMAAMLGLVVLYQSAVVIPGLKSAKDTVRPLTAVLLMSASRGEPTAVPIARNSRSAAVQMLLPPGKTFNQYICVIKRGSEEGGAEVSRTPVDAPPEGEPITLEIPSGKLAAGDHELVVYGRAADGGLSDQVSTYPFTVQPK